MFSPHSRLGITFSGNSTSSFSRSPLRWACAWLWHAKDVENPFQEKLLHFHILVAHMPSSRGFLVGRSTCKLDALVQPFWASYYTLFFICRWRKWIFLLMEALQHTHWNLEGRCNSRRQYNSSPGGELPPDSYCQYTASPFAEVAGKHARVQ